MNNIGNIGGDSYTMGCINCGSTSHLGLVAHRNEGLVTGWIVICSVCQNENARTGFELVFGPHIKR